MKLVLLGPPGVGKGTQGRRLAGEKGWALISTGEILREAVAKDTPLGREANRRMTAGELVEDATMIGLVRERSAEPDARGGFVLDGFPRTVAQAVALDGMVDDQAPLVIVDVEVPEEKLVERLSGRRICSSCGWLGAPGAKECARCGGALIQRPDDRPDVVRERLRVFMKATQPLVEYYRRYPTFRSVDGDQGESAVAADIAAAVASVLGDSR